MLKALSLTVAIALPGLLAAPTFAGDFRGQSRAIIENLTPNDAKLAFHPQKMKWEYETLYIWGTVKNTGSNRKEFVEISITALDSHRNFLGRETWYIHENHLNAGETGTLDRVFIETEGRVPAILQIQLSGNEK